MSGLAADFGHPALALSAGDALTSQPTAVIQSVDLRV
jgi:hypothetical protein